MDLQSKLKIIINLTTSSIIPQGLCRKKKAKQEPEIIYAKKKFVFSQFKAAIIYWGQSEKILSAVIVRFKLYKIKPTSAKSKTQSDIFMLLWMDSRETLT